MLTSLHQQIKKAFEDEGLSPEEIADPSAMGLEVGAVKAALMQCSSMYRKACGCESEDEEDLNFNNDELRMANQTLVRLMNSDDEHVAMKAAMYVRDDKKGRKEIVKAVQNNQFNILDINTMLQQARNGASAIKERFTSRKETAV